MPHRKAWKADPTAIGILSQVWGGVAPSELASALALQARNPQKKLGQALLETGAIKPQQLHDMLHKQELMRQGKSVVGDVYRLLDCATHRTEQASDALDKLIEGLRSVP
jgi:hypothetical protein